MLGGRAQRSHGGRRRRVPGRGLVILMTRDDGTGQQDSTGRKRKAAGGGGGADGPGTLAVEAGAIDRPGREKIGRIHQLRALFLFCETLNIACLIIENLNGYQRRSSPPAPQALTCTKNITSRQPTTTFHIPHVR